MTTELAHTLTVLFTDIEGSTELRTRRGEELGMEVLRAHEEVVRGALGRHEGREEKFLGDGFMVSFSSARQALGCAVAIQRGVERHNREHADRGFKLRIGLSAGEVLQKEGELYGMAVNAAARIMSKAKGGEILLDEVVKRLAGTVAGVTLADRGRAKLKGFEERYHLYQAAWQAEDPLALLAHTPFVGRAGELARLLKKLDETRGGRGAMVMLVGEPGIGKSRTCEQFAESVRRRDALVLSGRCYEGEWAPPFGPFAEAIAEYARITEPETIRRELGFGGPPLARLVPALRERLPDLGEPASLAPEEERFRLLDGVSQLLIAVSTRAPLVLVLDDLHWADRGTIAMLRHVARFIARHRILLLGAYRDVELDRQHPLADALGALRRETEYERIVLKGLDTGEVGELLKTVVDQEVPEALVKAISAETDGNPFFIREVLLHLIEEKKIFRQDGRWASNLTIEQMGIPEGVRQVIGRRLSRLSAEANRLLAAASAFDGAFRFEVAASVAGLDEAASLSAIDEAVTAQLLKPGVAAESYDFTHALIRHTLYGEMNPSRQVRLHRQIAEAMERAWASRTKEHAAEMAYHYSRSAALEG
ncbi:MAG: AAA family ATPase, partial [Candidatus Binataceae bacterium]